MTRITQRLSPDSPTRSGYPMSRSFIAASAFLLAIAATGAAPVGAQSPDAPAAPPAVTQVRAVRVTDETTPPSRIEISVAGGRLSIRVDGRELSADEITIRGDGVSTSDADHLRIIQLLREGKLAFGVARSGDEKFNVVVDLPTDMFPRSVQRLGADWRATGARPGDPEHLGAYAPTAPDGSERDIVIARRMLAEAGAGQARAALERATAFAGADAFMLAAPPRVMIGLTMDEPSAPLRSHLRLPEGRSTLVTAVVPSLPAAAAGIEVFDVIVAVHGTDAASPADIRRVLAETEPGESLPLRIIRGCEVQDVVVTVEAFDRERMAAAAGRMESGVQVTPDFFHALSPDAPGEIPLLWSLTRERLADAGVDQKALEAAQARMRALAEQLEKQSLIQEERFRAMQKQLEAELERRSGDLEKLGRQLREMLQRQRQAEEDERSEAGRRREVPPSGS